MNALRILSLDGGGFLGTATAEFIRATEEHFDISFANEFDMFCGTSTGGIIASALAQGMSGKQIVELYLSLRKKIFGGRVGIGLIRAKYDGVALKRALDATLGEYTFDDVRTRGKYLMLTAFNLQTGRPWIFKTDHSKRLSRDGRLPIASAALASAAAPTFFPAANVQYPDSKSSERLIDGGVAANHPSLLGYVEAISELGIPPEDVRILSIGTPRVTMTAGRNLPRKEDAGLLHWAKYLPTMMIDGNSYLAGEMLNRLVGDERYVRVDFANPTELDMDDTSMSAEVQLLSLGREQAANKRIRERIGQLIDRQV